LKGLFKHFEGTISSQNHPFSKQLFGFCTSIFKVNYRDFRPSFIGRGCKFPHTGPVKDLHLQVVRPAGRTKEKEVS
jgi:hypothetical protein